MTQRLSQFLVLATLLLLFAGGLVTSTDSGLAVPDWPLSYGSLFPPMVGGIRFEHTHRVIASAVGLITLILTVRIVFREKSKKVRWISIACLGAVVLQGILGGMTVLHKLPAWISMTHACLGPSFFALTVVLNELLKETKEEDVEAVEANPAGFLAPLTAAALLIQILLGAWVRHTGEGIALHVGWALAVFSLTGFLVQRILADFPDRPVLFRPASWMGILITVEFFLGIGAFIVTRVTTAQQAGRLAVLFPTIHQTLGAVLLAGSVLLSLRLKRYTRVVGAS